MPWLARQHKYAAVLGVAAAGLLIGGFLLKPAPPSEQSREPEATVTQAELDRLRELAQRNSLKNLSARFGSIAESASSHLALVGGETRSAVAWGNGTVLIARGMARLPAAVTIQSNGNAVQATPVNWPAGVPFAVVAGEGAMPAPAPVVRPDSLVQGAWVLLVTRGANDTHLFTPGTYSGVRHVACGAFSIDELQTSIALPEAAEGGGVFDLEGNLAAVVGRCDDGLAAIPAAAIRDALSQLQSSVTRVFFDLGMQLNQPDDAWRAYFHAPAGVVVTEIWNGWPADVSGFRIGDFIVSVNEAPAQTLADTARLLGNTTAEVTVQVKRGQRTVAIPLKRSVPTSEAPGVVLVAPYRGVELARVVPGSSASRAGLKRGDVIVSVNTAPATPAVVERVLSPFAVPSAAFVVAQRGARQIAALVQP